MVGFGVIFPFIESKKYQDNLCFRNHVAIYFAPYNLYDNCMSKFINIKKKILIAT